MLHIPIQFLLVLQSLDVEMEYGFEYIGSSPREVITPLTERCFVAMIQSVNAYMGTLCVGPIVSLLCFTVTSLYVCYTNVTLFMH